MIKEQEQLLALSGGFSSTELLTVGHSTLPLDEFLARLRGAGVGALADVRRFPASRRHPHFDRERLASALASAHVEYRWFEALGGRREDSAGAGDANAGLRVAGFRAYADYALTEPFRTALDDFLAWAGTHRVALCCAEALWWRCHRRILADHLVCRGHRVLHVREGPTLEPHRLWSLARPRVPSAGLTYIPRARVGS